MYFKFFLCIFNFNDFDIFKKFMKYSKLKKYLPRSFFGRALLIIILPIIFLEAIIGFAFIQRYFEQVTTQLAKSTVLQINYVLDRYENIVSEKREVFLDKMETKFDLKLTVVEQEITKSFVEKFAHLRDVEGHRCDGLPPVSMLQVRLAMPPPRPVRQAGLKLQPMLPHSRVWPIVKRTPILQARLRSPRRAPMHGRGQSFQDASRDAILRPVSGFVCSGSAPRGCRLTHRYYNRCIRECLRSAHF